MLDGTKCWSEWWAITDWLSGQSGDREEGTIRACSLALSSQPSPFLITLIITALYNTLRPSHSRDTLYEVAEVTRTWHNLMRFEKINVYRRRQERLTKALESAWHSLHSFIFSRFFIEASMKMTQNSLKCWHFKKFWPPKLTNINFFEGFPYNTEISQIFNFFLTILGGIVNHIYIFCQYHSQYNIFVSLRVVPQVLYHFCLILANYSHSNK